MNEDRIIERLKRSFPQMIGDDAAVLPKVSEHLVISKDILVENVHFRRRYQTPQSLAYKALAVNLSDIAAMGATPYGVFLGISANPKDGEFVDCFLEAFVTACNEANITLMGGDTTRAPSNELFLSLTILGKGEPHNMKYRHTAQPQDTIFIAGPLGEAHLGLVALERDMAGFEVYKAHFLNPKARLAEGQWLAKQEGVHAMMDVSDGLWLDLHKLVKASTCSAILPLEHLELPTSAQQPYHDLALSPVEIQLTGGEDYSLLFTSSSKFDAQQQTAFQKKFGYDLRRIGTITASSEGKSHGVQLLKQSKPVSIALHPFEHFEL